jgi:Tfp pilus assembly protein PilV
MRKNAGFSLVEVLLAFSILAFYLCGILLTYINMFMLTDWARDTTLATNAAQAKLEEVLKTPFDNLMALNATTFDVAGFPAANAKGRVEVCDNTTCSAQVSYSDLKRLRVVVCFKTRGRTIGEDTNFNGALNAGEDANGNSRLDCPVELITLQTK